MKRFFTLGALTLMLLPCVSHATDEFYINNGTLDFPPQIDAINVINNGTFDFFTTYPFDTSNTQNFTNNGTMFGSVGFRFDNAPSVSGIRVPAASFRNRLAGTITSADGPIFVGPDFGSLELTPSFLEVSAANIHNEGILTAGSAGL